MRAVSVAFSPGRPSRLKNEPGIFPVAYMRSSTSTVRGRKSTSRSEPATAVARTMVSPWRTTTAPEACLAILPVSNEISLPAISTEIRVTASLLMFTAFLFRPSVGGPFSFSRIRTHGAYRRRPEEPGYLTGFCADGVRDGAAASDVSGLAERGHALTHRALPAYLRRP